MKLFLKNTLYVLSAIVMLIILFFIISIICEYRPKDKESLFTITGTTEAIPDSLTILSWNIGYAGLGDNMDFFYDGGKKVRDTRERSEYNLDCIIKTLKQYRSEIILLQEVDLNSHRTYRIDEVERLKEEFPDYMVFFAYNYKAWHVPIPLREPIGKVESGLVIMTRFVPLEICRLQYPSRFPFPVSLFNLKRCLLYASFLTSQGDTLFIGNTHNTAFDTGNMRNTEMKYLENIIKAIAENGNLSIIGGDWNQYPPDYTPKPQELDNPFFSPAAISDTLMGRYGRFDFDPLIHSLRFNDHPFDTTSICTTTDFFFLSDNITTRGVSVIDLGFKNSDHNPIIINIRI